MLKASDRNWFKVDEQPTKAVHYCNDNTIDQKNQLMPYTKQKQSINAIIAIIEPHTALLKQKGFFCSPSKYDVLD